MNKEHQINWLMENETNSICWGPSWNRSVGMGIYDSELIILIYINKLIIN